MAYKVCVSCNKIIQDKDKVDYDVFASIFKYDSSGSIIGSTEKPMTVHFHKKCFDKYKKDEKKKSLYFTQETGSNRLVIKSLF